ncbi:MAG: PspC domain-containing protein [Actinomycetota bacterium]
MAARSQLIRPARGDGRVIAGVCAALASRFGLSRTLVRLAFLLFGLVGAGEIVYLLLWILIPKDRGQPDPTGSTLAG